jgi:hypothetical protein
MGHCFDLYGAITKNGLLDVRTDWALKPVYGKDGKRRPDGWGQATQTYYRLRQNLDDPAYSFFKDVYQFASEQCVDGSGGVIGKPSFIIHPDHPDPDLRENHEQHMHLQIGKTKD